MCSRVSRAPPNRTLPAFLNLSDISTSRDFFLILILNKPEKFAVCLFGQL